MPERCDFASVEPPVDGALQPLATAEVQRGGGEMPPRWSRTLAVIGCSSGFTRSVLHTFVVFATTRAATPSESVASPC